MKAPRVASVGLYASLSLVVSCTPDGPSQQEPQVLSESERVRPQERDSAGVRRFKFLDGCTYPESHWEEVVVEADQEQDLLTAVLGYRDVNFGFFQRLNSGFRWYEDDDGKVLFCALHPDYPDGCFAERYVIDEASDGFVVVDNKSFICTE